MKTIVTPLLFVCSLLLCFSCSGEHVIDDHSGGLQTNKAVGALAKNLQFVVHEANYQQDNQLTDTRTQMPYTIHVDKKGFTTFTFLTSEPFVSNPLTRGIEQDGNDIYHLLILTGDQQSGDQQRFREVINIESTRDADTGGLNITDEYKKIFSDKYQALTRNGNNPTLTFLLYSGGVEAYLVNGETITDDQNREQTWYSTLQIKMQAGTRPRIAVSTQPASALSELAGDDPQVVFQMQYLDYRMKSDYVSPVAIESLKGFFAIEDVVVRQQGEVNLARLFSTNSVDNAFVSDPTSTVKSIRAQQVSVPASSETPFANVEGLFDFYRSTTATNNFKQYIYMLGRSQTSSLLYYVTTGKMWGVDLADYSIYSDVGTGVSNRAFKRGYNYVVKTSLLPPLSFWGFIRDASSSINAGHHLGVVVDANAKIAALINPSTNQGEPKAWAIGDAATKSLKAQNTLQLQAGQSLQQVLRTQENTQVTTLVDNRYPALESLQKSYTLKAMRTTDNFMATLPSTSGSNRGEIYLPSIGDWNQLLSTFAMSEPLVYEQSTKGYWFMLDVAFDRATTSRYAALSNASTSITNLNEDRKNILQALHDNVWYWTSTEVWDDAAHTTASKALALRFHKSNNTVEVSALPKTSRCYVLPFVKYASTSDVTAL